MTKKLKPCPFCGGKPKWDELGSFGMVNEKPLIRWFYVECLKCEAKSGYKKYGAWAIKAWNRRAK